MTTAKQMPASKTPTIASWMRRDSHAVRVVARRDIVGREWTFYKGRHLLGVREKYGWAVWPRRDPTSFLTGVPDELVREIE